MFDVSVYIQTDSALISPIYMNSNQKNEMPVINERTPNCIESYDTEMCVNFHYGAMQVTTRAEDYGTDRTDITNPYMRHSICICFRRRLLRCVLRIL